ncbi:hypothetical protein VTN00DRAFT_792 [Thermoascus crustaceus]|uniref:uncharacterized protein n=1 Tax=Thermoascus crustaceus TaxID=5088 RepID=UPI00374446D0
MKKMKRRLQSQERSELCARSSFRGIRVTVALHRRVRVRRTMQICYVPMMLRDDRRERLERWNVLGIIIVIIYIIRVARRF